ncbi:hypothetical protein EV424DRAFT_934663 [Suillus variegatus]|nr:hypothetical protein EV424DRAFT_934663 [Suillus variegatus]
MLSCCLFPARSSQSQSHLQCVQTWDLLLTTLPDILRIRGRIKFLVDLRWRCMSDSMHQGLITPAASIAPHACLYMYVWFPLVHGRRFHAVSNESMIVTMSVLSLVILPNLSVTYVATALVTSKISGSSGALMSVNAVAAAGDVLIAAYLCTFFALVSGGPIPC